MDRIPHQGEPIADYEADQGCKSDKEQSAQRLKRIDHENRPYEMQPKNEINQCLRQPRCDQDRPKRVPGAQEKAYGQPHVRRIKVRHLNLAPIQRARASARRTQSSQDWNQGFDFAQQPPRALQLR